ncbi:GtrA family protein [Lutibacter sp.]
MSLLENNCYQSIKFVIVGGINTGITYAIYVALIYIGLHYSIALSLLYIIGIVSGYFMNRYWTFASHKQCHRSFIKYSSSYVIIYFINLLLLALLVNNGLMEAVLAQLVILVITTIISFFIQKKWVFKSQFN